jgi:hypothetical protein
MKIDLAILILAGLLAACAQPVPSTPAATSTSPPAPSSAVASARLAVRFGGTIGCGKFPYGCTARLSVLAPGSAVDDAWRPPDSDPWWGPDWSEGLYNTNHLNPTPVGDLPDLASASHELVVSLLGSYDTPSFTPDGKLATDLLARCSAELGVRPTTRIVDVVVTFTPDPQSFRATCALKVGQQP